MVPNGQLQILPNLLHGGVTRALIQPLPEVIDFHEFASIINTNAHVAAQRQDASNASVPFFSPPSPLPH
ncbi:hypothetical protein HYALB_00012657 [Hymenoscyphus albidus]|uniref:Uncharacterized protein n=1 Tax=Hymenoscyphus albidus TaxID=595503 RepID=A0A9N9Q607_9HELO|nr:hypothetical protein HYALB_00012657 [Hymenoscyphus albidus]